jgi:hypothetical protein
MQWIAKNPWMRVNEADSEQQARLGLRSALGSGRIQLIL